MNIPDNAKNYIYAVEDFIEAKFQVYLQARKEDTILIENPFDI